MSEPIVIDNFLPNPEEYREAALMLPFQSFVFEHCTFHGICPQSLDNIVPMELSRRFTKFRPNLSFFRHSPIEQEEPHFIHTDVDMGEFSTVLYLNPDPPAKDGTVFWTHGATGAADSNIPHERSKEGLTTKGWIKRKFVQAVFNRLVAFPSNMFHSRAIYNNWTKDGDSRLTQVTFGLGVIE